MYQIGIFLQKEKKTAQNTNNIPELTNVSSKYHKKGILFIKTPNHPIFNSKTIVINSDVSVGKQNNVY